MIFRYVDIIYINDVTPWKSKYHQNSFVIIIFWQDPKSGKQGKSEGFH